MKTKENRGVTLIALVITIVVLIVLAGISIGTLSGNNGIISKTQDAKKETEIANWEEQIDQAIVEVEGSKDNPTMDDIIEELINRKIIASSSDVNEETGTIKTKDPSYEIKGKLNDYTIIKTNAAKLAYTINKTNIYGAKVNGYTLPSTTSTDVGWKIFYTDGSNIYLIADNYIEEENLPYCTFDGEYFSSSKPTSNNNGYYKRVAYFSSSSVSAYTGLTWITDSKVRKLSQKLFDYLDSDTVSTTDNIRAIAYLLDTKAWNSKFLDTNEKAEFVIGAPTLELLLDSYNGKYRTNYTEEIYNNSGVVGYRESEDGGKTYEESSILNMEKTDDTYVIKDTKYAAVMVVASPYAYTSNSLMYVHCNGYTTAGTATGAPVGFRPIVCLKSDVQLKVESDGTYTIL